MCWSDSFRHKYYKVGLGSADQSKTMDQEVKSHHEDRESGKGIWSENELNTTDLIAEPNLNGKKEKHQKISQHCLLE